MTYHMIICNIAHQLLELIGKVLRFIIYRYVVFALCIKSSNVCVCVV